MSHIPSSNRALENLVALNPDFPFHYSNFLSQATENQQPLFTIPEENYGKKVLIVGAGISGLIAGYELMKMGLHPVIVDSSGDVGGRLMSKKMGEQGKESIAELGAMRFPVSGKTIFHYFDKFGLSQNSTDFPNPNTAAAISSVVDYKGNTDYYETDGAGGSSERWPIPTVYNDIETKFFDYLSSSPINLDEMTAAMTEGTLDPSYIKTVWNNLLNPDDGSPSWDSLSFYRALKEDAGWSYEDMSIFGQVGFGTGGWNTDYPNCFLEVLRVIYTGLDTNHRLMYDGAQELARRLWTMSPASVGDAMNYWDENTTLESLAQSELANPLNMEVRHISKQNTSPFTYDVGAYDLINGVDVSFNAWEAVIYTPHVRILDKLRHVGGVEDYQKTTALFDQDTWEAIEYTHYMQSSKVFWSAESAFWRNREKRIDSKEPMSITLSDRITRGTYLVDYSGNDKVNTSHDGAGIFLSYTWNDDSLKFLGDKASPNPNETGAGICKVLLSDIYPNVDFDSQLQPFSDTTVIEHNWEDQTYYLGGFKMNLPGHYNYQRRLFSQFMDGVAEGSYEGFILAGDDISWTGGWSEGAASTAINAVNKVALIFGGVSELETPIDQWDELGPIALQEV